MSTFLRTFVRWLGVVIIVGCLWIRCVRCESRSRASGPVVAVSSGGLQGVREAGQGHARDYLAFRGIPYAQPPLGHLRFKAPRPPASWQGVRAADKDRSVCPQKANGQYVGSEDCLYLNVFTPSLDCPAGGLAVMLFVHGGSFMNLPGGSLDYYGPDFLVDQNVVLVSIHYRSHAFGFLNLNTEGIPGNAGLKDIVAALRWVQQNIHAFCGDPAKVTVFGQSAGAKAISYLGISELSRGLYRAVIEMSGNAMSLMAYTERNEDWCRELAARLGAKQDAASVEAALRTASAEDITRIVWDIYYNVTPWRLPYNPFVPSRELRPPDSEPVLMTEDPEYLLSHPPVPRRPTLTGVVSREGLTFSKSLLTNAETMEAMRSNLADFVQHSILRIGSNSAKLFQVDPLPSDIQKENVAQKVREVYFHGNDISADYPEDIANFLGDVRYTFPLCQFARRLDNQTAPLYLYLFDVVTEYNIYSRSANLSISGAAHEDDFGYLFRLGSISQDLNDPGLAGTALRRHVQLFTDFAKTLSSPLLPPDASRRRAEAPEAPLPYLYIGPSAEVRTANTLGAGERMAFWDDVTANRRRPGGPGGSAAARAASAAVVAAATALLLFSTAA